MSAGYAVGDFRPKRKLAKNHELVFEALKRASGPVTAYELIDVLRPSGIKAPPTVYRALNRLIDEGLAHRLESLNAFVACRHDHAHVGGEGPCGECGEEHGAGSVVFLICRECGQVTEVVDEAISKGLSARTVDEGFRPESAVFEVVGLCQACADA